MRQKCEITLFVFVILFLFSGEIFAGGGVYWQENGVLVCDSTFGGGLYPIDITSDGYGGAIIVWEDGRTLSGIASQRIDSLGNVMWEEDGVFVDSFGESPSVISDGSGGAIITWMSYGYLLHEKVYVQRVSSNGIPLWGYPGIPVTYTDSLQQYPSIVSDGAGGCIIAWIDHRNGNADIYAQRVDSSGTRLWGNLGVPICSDGAEQAYPYTATFGDKGAVIVWPDKRNGDWDAYGQRINGNGNILWDSNGKIIYSDSGDQYPTNIVNDNRNGVIIVWEAGDFINWDFDIYAQRLDSNGVVCWDTNGVAICNEDSLEYHSKIVSDGKGGIVVVWLDERTSFRWDVYVQRVDSNGICLWDSNGIFVNTMADTSQEPTWLHPQICSDNRSGAIVSWQDYHNGNWDIYCQRVDSSGVLQWGVGGLPVCTTPEGQDWGPVICEDGENGAIIAWGDRRYHASVFAQRVVDVEGVEETENSDFGFRNSELKVHPNPFTTFTQIAVSLPSIERPDGIVDAFHGTSSAQDIELNIFDIAGRKIRRLMPEKNIDSKSSILNYIWNGKNIDGEKVNAGIYFIKAESKTLNIENTRKIILIH